MAEKDTSFKTPEATGKKPAEYAIASQDIADPGTQFEMGSVSSPIADALFLRRKSAMRKPIRIPFAVCSFFLAADCGLTAEADDSQAGQCGECVEHRNHEFRWGERCEIPYFVEPDFPESYATNVRPAFNAWADETGISFDEEKAPDTTPSKITIEFRKLSEEEIEGYEPCNNDSSRVPLAVTKHYSNPLGSTIAINSAHDWTTRGDRTMQLVLMHEIGHALGLRHIANDPSALMYCWNIGQTGLNQTDIAAIRSILRKRDCGTPIGTWCANRIDGSLDPDGNPLVVTCDVSRFVFRSDNSYSWYLHALPYYYWDDAGTYTYENGSITLDGAASELPIDGSIACPEGSTTFTFLDEDYDRWVYELDR